MGVGKGHLPVSLARTYYIILGALLRCNRVPSLPKVYSPRQISTVRRLPKGGTSIEAGATYQ